MAQAQTLSLTASNYNGNNISCFGAQDGSINLTITGGTPPYTIRWSNDATTEDISNLAAGFYMVEVDDADTTTDMVSADITLTEPEALSVELTASDYLVNARHYNISLSGACNGSITPTVTGGTTPYTCNWEPYGQTTANLSNICAGGYNLNVTDANGCATPAQQDMTEPDRDDWQMNGNANTNATTQFIGTLDNQDFSLRTYNQERLRIKANGDFKINSLAGTGYELMMTDANGNVLRLNKQNVPNLIPWYTRGNDLIDDQYDFIGPINDKDFIFKTGSFSGGTLTEKMRITKTGNVGIGTDNPSQKLEIAHSDADGGIAINRTGTSSGKSEIKFLADDTPRWAIGMDLGNNNSQTFFIWNHYTSGASIYINEQDRVGIGVNPPINNTSPYKLYVEGGIVTRDVKVTAAQTFPDYVFAKDYKLMSLYELQQYIKINNHLPEMPSAKEIEKNNGYEVGDMVTKLLKKTEEQTLYIIEQQKQIDELKAAVKKLERRK